MATASSRRRAIASSVRCSTATLLRIVQPVRPETFGGSSCSPGERTDQLSGAAFPPLAPYNDPGRLAPSRALERSTSTNPGSLSGATSVGQLISGLGIAVVALVPASAKSAAARSSPESKALPSPNHSSSWIEAPPTVVIAPVLITTT